MKLPNLSPLRLFAPVRHRQLQTATANGAPGGTMMFASGYGDDGGDEDSGATETSSRSGRTLRSSGAAGSGGRQRTIQVPPEERYWTEYLRIALPIVGLLLMIGVFWFWAQQLIGDGNDPDEPIPTNPPGQTSLVEDESTPEPTRPAVVDNGATEPADPSEEEARSTPDPSEEEPASGGDDAAEETAAADDEEPAEEEPADAAFSPDDTVTVNDDGVNLRADPVVEDDNVVVTLNTGATLTIVEGPEAGEDYNWWNVVDEDGNNGWIAEDFIELAE